jgi:hypothetical protein
MIVCFVGSFLEYFSIGKSYDVLDYSSYSYLIEDDLGDLGWQDRVDDKGYFRFVEPGYSVKFIGGGGSIGVSYRQAITTTMVSRVQLDKNNKLVFNTFFTYLVYNKCYLTFNLNDIEDSSENIYLINEDKMLVGIKRDDDFLINFTEVTKIREDKLNIILGCI